jgi:ferredoxin
VRVEADRTKCAGIGMCEMLAPDVFEVGDDGAVHVHNDAVTQALDAALHEAVGSCPTAALRIAGDDEG